jgi:hypothetical protein
MRAPAPIRTLPALLLAVAIGGCGLQNPYQAPAQQTTTTTATTNAAVPADQRDPAPERGGAVPSPVRAGQSRLAAGAGSATPQAALARYARTYLNWNAGNVITVQRTLAATSLGQARAQALQAAASAARDTKLTASQIANHGRVVAIAAGQAQASGRWVIVTSEQTTGQGDYLGLPPTLHVIYAQLTHTGMGWVVSGWQPQN